VGTLPVNSASTETSISVDLDRSVDLADKQVGGVEADRSRQQPECKTHQSGVAEVKQRRYKLRDFQLNRRQAKSEDHSAVS